MKFRSHLLVVLIVQLVLSSDLCDKNYFKLKGMTECHRFLTCDDLPSINLIKTIGYGAVKHVFLAHWGQHEIAYSVLKNTNYTLDFQEGLKTLQLLNPSRFIVQLVGFCKTKNIIFTEYHFLNNAINLLYLLKNNNQFIGLKLCLNYAQILNFIHNSPIGVRVNCDSDSLKKILSQLLVKSDISLVLNDVDALPELTNSSVKCGNEERTEKSDIFKFPDICEHFLKLSDEYISVQYALYDMFKKCWDPNPLKRPSSSSLVNYIMDLLNDYK